MDAPYFMRTRFILAWMVLAKKPKMKCLEDNNIALTSEFSGTSYLGP